jgi:hypothetical protein
MMRSRAEMLSRMTAARSPLATQMGTTPRGPLLNTGGAQGAITGTEPTVDRLLPQDWVDRLPGRARGGPVKAGKPYVVGERGPEVVVPRQNGTVLPAHWLILCGLQGGGSERKGEPERSQSSPSQARFTQSFKQSQRHECTY